MQTAGVTKKGRRVGIVTRYRDVCRRGELRWSVVNLMPRTVLQEAERPWPKLVVRLHEVATRVSCLALALGTPQ